MRVIVLGGTGFIGRHAAAALAAHGHEVGIGTRCPHRAARRLPLALRACTLHEVHMERLTARAMWHTLLAGYDIVVNAVGILRPRGAETYDRVHHRGPAALAASCALTGRRLIHLSALGLSLEARSRFIRSKLAGEDAVKASGADHCIVRPSLLDGEGGFGADWLRGVARWPVHFVPADAKGRIAALDVRDLGEAVATLCEKPTAPDDREVELGGGDLWTIAEYLAALRPAERAPAVRLTVPRWLARLTSHLFDLAHFTPFSFGHFELLGSDNVPRRNKLSMLLGRAPLRVGSARTLSSGLVVGLGKFL